jgi:hypothetical protein
MLRRLGCLLTLIVGAASAAQAPPARVLPGWLGVFPEVGMYSRRLEVPKSEKESWQQSARYEWSGGRSEMIRVTLMRDAAEAKKYAFDAKNPLPDTVKKVKVAERDAYEYPGGKLVIDLGKDRMPFANSRRACRSPRCASASATTRRTSAAASISWNIAWTTAHAC